MILTTVLKAKYNQSLNNTLEAYLPIITRSLVSVIFVIYPFAAFIISLMLTALDFDVKFNRLVVGMFFGLYGFSFIPGVRFDITRHQETYVHYTHMGFMDFFFSLLVSMRPDFLMELTFLILGKFFINPQMVGFVGAFVFYYFFVAAIDNCFTYIFPFEKTFFRYLLIFFMFSAATVTFTFSGIRNGPASMVFLYLLTKGLNLNKKRNILLLFVPGMIHFSMIPIALLYILAFKSSKILAELVSIIIILTIPLMYVLFTAMYKIFLNVSGFGFLVYRLNFYLLSGSFNSNGYAGAGFRYYLVVLPLVFVSIIFWLVINKCYKNFNSNFCNYHKFVILLFSYALFVIRTHIFARLLLVFVYISIIYILYCLWTYHFRSRVLKQFMILACFYVVWSIIPSWYMGNEYLCINPVLLKGSLIDVLSVKITPNDYIINI